MHPYVSGPASLDHPACSPALYSHALTALLFKRVSTFSCSLQGATAAFPIANCHFVIPRSRRMHFPDKLAGMGAFPELRSLDCV